MCECNNITAVTETELDINLEASSIVHLENYVLAIVEMVVVGLLFSSIILSLPLFFGHLMVSGLVSPAYQSICSVK